MRLLLIISLIASVNVCAQKKTRFGFDDKSFSVGSIHKVEPGFQNDFEETLVKENSFYENNKKTFDQIIKFLEDNPGISLEIGCHTDARGSEKANLELSLTQAERIVKVLIEHGISEERLIAKGYGESELAVPPAKTDVLKGDAKENAHKMNRRTELKIIEIKEL